MGQFRVRRWAMAAMLMLAAGPGQAQTGSAIRPAPSPGEASAATRAANHALAERLPLADPSDFDDARRGRIAQIPDGIIRDETGDIIWSSAALDFLQRDPPDTANPSLWRQSRLAAEHGLFEVTDGIWQVRGYDLSVMTVVRGQSGWIVIDPLTTVEAARAALALVNDTLGTRPVSALIYTHSHADHFGGARGIIDEAEIAARSVPVIAPIGFAREAVAENLLAGTHMSRRATLMFGRIIPPGPTSHIGSGLGPGLAGGSVSLILPTEEIDGDGTRRTIDGVAFEFVDAAGTEAPAEFVFYLPDHRALHTAEVATATFHNVLTMRGAQVRDALRWSRVIDDMLQRYGGEAEVALASHHWPSWGSENVRAWLADQRDIYRYVHDQVLRRANSGATMAEAAEAIEEPDSLGRDFAARGYYGSLNHNAKAVYQHYFGWWGGVMADFHRLPEAQSAARYVAAMGGADALLERGIAAYDLGDYRWAAELFNHLVFADPQDERGRDWLAASYEQMGFQAESGAWRSYYLAGAAELRGGTPAAPPPAIGSPDFLRAVPTLQLFDMIASRYAPERLARDPFALQFHFSDTGENVALMIERSVIVPRSGVADTPAATLTLTRPAFEALLLQSRTFADLARAGEARIEGDPTAFQTLFALLEQPTFWFATQTP